MIGAGALALVVGLVLLAGAALLARIRIRLAYAGIGFGALAFVGAGLVAGLTGTFDWGGWTGPLGESEFLRVDALSAYFLIVVGIVGVAVAIWALGDDRSAGPGLPMGMATLLLGDGLLLAAPTSLLFLAGWEIMTLGAFAGLLQGSRPRERVLPAAYVFLGLGEVSALGWIVAWGALRAARGSWLLSGGPVPAEWAGIIFVAGAVAATLKMGVLPFQIGEWLPLTRASAPAPIAALVSAAVTGVGAYGLLRLITILGGGPAWWGGLLLIVGCGSALVGALWASVSDHPQGLLAYSTIENNGLILVALGASLIASAYGLTVLAAVALFAALFQVFAHASAKAG
ncbi:MAG: proton-conducting transporter membrane subunit, partial [Thermoplasmata archaeon]